MVYFLLPSFFWLISLSLQFALEDFYQNYYKSWQVKQRLEEKLQKINEIKWKMADIREPERRGQLLSFLYNIC